MLLKIFAEINNNSITEKLDRNRFRALLHKTFNMTDDIILDRSLAQNLAFNKRLDGLMTQEEWVRGLSIFLRGTLAERAACKISEHYN
ncbi:unnamed protein product [Dibothriocephalus latus]|uniref:Uncharacterized protein n=1 Tax=Dibothriocephalus latus TaxID=60516 RepID=A0A3P7L8L6_DIBLA|nr:unnamed protein product [Dibothriocephalus latus]